MRVFVRVYCGLTPILAPNIYPTIRCPLYLCPSQGWDWGSRGSGAARGSWLLFWGSKLGQQTGQQAKAQGKCTTVPDHTPCKVVPIVTLSIPSTPLSLEGLCLARSSPFVIGAAKLRFGAAKLQFEFHLKKKTSEKCGAPARASPPATMPAGRAPGERARRAHHRKAGTLLP